MPHNMAATRRDGSSAAVTSELRLDPGAFRDAMAMLAGGVAIAACWDGDTPKGLLISSITALSTEPPRMLFCVRKASASHNALLRAERCSLAVLAEKDRLEADRFSRTDRTDERFGPEQWSLDPKAPPRHLAPLIGIEGVIGHRIDAGTHTIFIMNVREVRIRPDRPLVYFDRDFRGLAFADAMTAHLESLAGVTVWSAGAQASSDD